MKSLKIAFYKARYGTWLDKTIAFISNGKYSHVELIFDYLSFSSSPRKGGVAMRFATFKESGDTDKEDNKITFIAKKWDIIEISVSDERYDKIWRFCIKQIGKKYDWLWAISSVFPILPDSNNKWFCTEVIIAAFHSEKMAKNIKEKITPVEMYKQINEEISRQKTDKKGSWLL